MPAHVRPIPQLHRGWPVGQSRDPATDYEQCLLSVASYDPHIHTEVEDLIDRRLTLEIRYESLYGEEDYAVVLRPRR